MKKIIIIFLISALLLTTGCWDRREINEIIFPYSVGLDLLDKGNFEGGRYKITFTHPNINALGDKAIQEDVVLLESVEGNNIFEATANLTDRLSRLIYLRDLKTVVLSEALGEDSRLMRELIDGLNRDYVVNQGLYFVVVGSFAKELLETKVKSKEQAEVQGLLYKLIRNEQDSVRFTPSTLHNFTKEMNMPGATLVPVARTEGKKIIINSNAVFKDYRLVGYLDKEDNKNVSLLTNKIKDFRLNVDYQGADLSVRAPRPKAKKKLIQQDGKLKMKYFIKVKGQLEQFIAGKGHELDSEGKLRSVEEALGSNLEESIKKTVKKIQKELNADVIGVSDYLYKFEPDIWENIKDNFYEIFPEMDIEIETDVIIKRRGLVK